MTIVKLLPICCCFLLAACAGTRSSAIPPGQEYVEVDNPTITMSPNAPAKIWVPRSYVEEGPPRGGELIKRGVESVVGSSK